MRFLLKFQIPTDRGNSLIKSGKFAETLQSVMEDIKPEAAYFTDVDGTRGGYLIVNMDDVSELPSKAEPLFFSVGATISLHAVMTPEDLQKGGGALEEAAQKYG